MTRVRSIYMLRQYTLLAGVMKSSLSRNFDVVLLDTDQNLTTEMYLIRVIAVAVLVLTGGFFAGKILNKKTNI
jgi:hypothetical protein